MTGSEREEWLDDIRRSCERASQRAAETIAKMNAEEERRVAAYMEERRRDREENRRKAVRDAVSLPWRLINGIIHRARKTPSDAR